MSSNNAALSPFQKAQVRFHCGYRNFAADDNTFTLYPWFRLGLQTLEWNLDHLRPEEYTFFLQLLTNCQTSYQNWIDSQDNMDALQIAIIKNNPIEPQNRRDFYSRTCEDLCDFFGIVPGPSFVNKGNGSASLVVV
jgi:hypothetical protein